MSSPGRKSREILLIVLHAAGLGRPAAIGWHRTASAAVLLGLAAVAQASAESLFVEGCDPNAEVITEYTPIRWDRGVLRFACARLADVIAEYNRHASVKLAVSNAELADVLIGGAFKTEDPVAFVSGLQRVMSLRTERRGDTVWLMPIGQ